jgi:hypothetical protein
VFQASQAAHALGCNPGGEVIGEPLEDDEAVPAEFTNRLLSERDLDELKRRVAELVGN